MVTVLVAAYNARETLEMCLDSLCEQSYKDLEIVCIDDASTDTTLTYLEERATLDYRIKVVKMAQNSGQAVARNEGLKVAKGEYVMMVDADDWLSEDAVAKAVEVFEKHPATDCVVLHLIEVENDKETDYGLPEALKTEGRMTGLDAFEACLDAWKLHGLYVARRRLYNQFRFDTTTRLYSDDNTSRLHYLHSREVRACEGRYYYRKHPQSMTRSFNLHRFDFMEANLSLLFALKKETLRPGTLKKYEGQRWMTFIRCYRMFIIHQNEIQEDKQLELKERLKTVLHTFRPSRLPFRYRWKPGYWLTLSAAIFDLQQRFYLKLKGTRQR